tara:strand:+ start:79 stop:1878 length:1800 start_codon:yes stop_codon:yes gene_type:complete
MSTTFLILLLFLCVIIIIGLGSGFYLFKGKTEETTPTITVDDVSVESETPSGNTEMYTYDELSKNVKINVTWSNGPDFDDVTNLYFTRTKGSVTDKKETDAQGRTSNSNGNKIVYIQKAGEDMRGQHTIKVTYKLRGQTQENELTSFVANISEDQLTLTKDSLKPIPVTYSPATVPFSADVETKKTTVTLNPEPSGFGSLYFIPSGANNAIKIKRISDGKFLKHNASFQASGDTFYAQSAANNRNRISTTDTDEGKLLTAVGPTLKKYKDMNIEERTKSLFTFTFSPTPTPTPTPPPPPPTPFSFDLCTSDWNKLIQECKNVSTCKAVGQQDNGCWHELKADPTTAQLNSYKPLLQKKHDYGLFYLGEAGCNVNIKNVGAACLSNSKCTGVGKQSNNCWHTLQNSGSTKKLLTGYTEFKRPKDLEYQACTNDQTYIKAACDADPNCKSIGQQTNGCWHLLPRDPNVDDYNNYKKPILRKANSYGKYSYYLGEGGCHNNRQSVVNDCNNNTDCTFAGQQSNGCWHLLSGKPSGNIIDTSGYSNKYNRKPSGNISNLDDKDAQCYLDRYPDLQNAFGPNNTSAAKTHWINHGKGEKRNPLC